MTFTFGSLFAGIGGFDLGLERAGMTCAWQAEIDPRCNELLHQRWPLVDRRRDVREVRADHVARVDLISGGFPCQDLSVAGRRAGLAGEQSGLWREFHRVLFELRPAWVLVENVPGLLSSNGGRDLAVVLRGLVELGYGVAYRILDAQYFGVPQRRRRVFIVGHLGDGRAAEVLFESESLSGDPPARGEAGEGIAGTLGGSSQSGGFRTTDLDNSGAFVFEPRFARNDQGRPNAVVPPLKAQSGQSGKGDGAPLVFDPSQDSGTRRRVPDPVSYPLGVDSPRPVVFDARGQNIVVGPLAPNAGPRSHDAGNFHCNQGVDAGHILAVSENQRAEIPLTDYSPDLTSGGGKPGQGYGAAMVHGRVRRLTPTECERLQGFPDGWTDGFADSIRYRMLGNAVCVPVADWIARRILEYHDSTEE